jgi:F-type H+-transporting ATPase subunit b
MPQLNTLTYSSQLFWLGICFLTLYLILAYVILPKITRILEVREESIEEKLNKASTYREQAEDLRADYEGILVQAKEKAHQHLKSTSITISAAIANKQKDFLDKLSDRLHVAEQELYRSRLESGKEIESLARDVANAIFLKLTGKVGSFEKDGRHV